jgi:uncharacterized membrane protein YfcA
VLVPVDLDPLAIALIAASGVLAGVANALAGGGTLIAYPVLLSVGIPPVAANIACSVGLVPGYAGSAAAYRAELREARALLVPLLGAAIAGGALGALLLLRTPDDTFEVVVPPLVLGGALLLAVQPAVSRRLAARAENSARRRPAVSIAALIAVVLCGAYGSFFGAGLGVLLLASLALLVTSDVQIGNALKSLLSFVCVATGVIVFIGAGDVVWSAALLLVVGSLIGGWTGARIGRRLPPQTLRTIVVVLGLIVGTVLAIRTYT